MHWFPSEKKIQITYFIQFMKYYLMVHLAIVGNLFAQSDTAEGLGLENKDQQKNDDALLADSMGNDSVITGSVKDSLINSNKDAGIEFMKLVIESDGEDWQAFRGELEIPKSHFFRIVGDDSKYELARNAERNFRRKKFKLVCINCSGAFFGLTFLALSQKDVAALSAGIYLGGYVYSKLLKMETINVDVEDAEALAREYNQKLREESSPAI